jgi:uncharacterized protein
MCLADASTGGFIDSFIAKFDLIGRWICPITILNHITGIAKETARLYMEMAPYLLLGLAVAGVLYVLLPTGKVLKHLSRRNFGSTLKATLFGIPLPLCSCSVIPVATHLRREGASRGSTLAFLVSTPSSGVDSILATYSLMGWLFAVGRTVADFVTGLVAGTIMNFVERNDPPDAALIPSAPETSEAQSCCNDTACCGSGKNAETENGIINNSLANPEAVPRWRRMASYAFVTLVRDIGWWLLAGIVLGGVISYAAPPDLVQKYLGNPWLAYPAMLLVALPLYVCATGSIPVVAPLLMMGLTPGAALVFLIIGPSTNTATIAVVGRLLGKKALIVYLASLTLCAFAFGLVMDAAWVWLGGEMTLAHVHEGVLPVWLKAASAVILAVCFLNAVRPRRNVPTSAETASTRGISTQRS